MEMYFNISCAPVALQQVTWGGDKYISNSSYSFEIIRKVKQLEVHVTLAEQNSHALH